MRAVGFQVVRLKVERGQVLGNMRPVGKGEKKVGATLWGCSDWQGSPPQLFPYPAAWPCQLASS
jgi:hypothetical protein